jgi:hypothetical protein
VYGPDSIDVKEHRSNCAGTYTEKTKQRGYYEQEVPHFVVKIGPNCCGIDHGERRGDSQHRVYQYEK